MAAPVFVAAGLRHRETLAPTAPARWRRCSAGCCSSTASGMPMSATSTGPQCSRPGSSRWPGLRRKNVTVSLACTAAPITAPLSPLMPLGRSTAITGTPAALIASIIARAAPSTGRSRPAPNSASTIRSAPASAAGAAGSTGPCQRRAASAASPLSLLAVAEQQQPDRIAALGQDARADKAVAAVVAGPGHDARPSARRAGCAAPPRRRPPGRRSPSARCPASRRRSRGGRPRPFPRWSAARSWRRRQYRRRPCAGQRRRALDHALGRSA